jgi:hypothetical protein
MTVAFRTALMGRIAGANLGHNLSVRVMGCVLN